MAENWKREKEIPSKTELIDLETPACGNMHLTFCWQDDSLIEVRAVIGKSGVCGNIMLDTIAKLMSMYLQSSEPKYKIVKKFRKQFLPDTKGNQITCGHGKGKSCIEEIAERVVKELEK